MGDRDRHWNRDKWERYSRDRMHDRRREEKQQVRSCEEYGEAIGDRIWEQTGDPVLAGNEAGVAETSCKAGMPYSSGYRFGMSGGYSSPFPVPQLPLPQSPLPQSETPPYKGLKTLRDSTADEPGNLTPPQTPAPQDCSKVKGCVQGLTTPGAGR